jgi:hypothetical protein
MRDSPGLAAAEKRRYPLFPVVSQWRWLCANHLTQKNIFAAAVS